MIPRLNGTQIATPTIFGLLLAGFLLTIPSNHASAQQAKRIVRSRQIKINHARPVSHSKSTLSRAATGQTLAELPPKPLDGSLVKQVNFVDGCDTCGSHCTCGTEAVYAVEPTCGCDTPVCSCGVEALDCPIEVASCGVEVGPGCGLEECVSCQPSAVAAVPVCGVESCDGGCDSCCDATSIFNSNQLVSVRWKRYEFFLGSQGFKGPMNFASLDPQNLSDRRGSGSFGFYQGFNAGRPLRGLLGGGLSGQFGLRATQNNLSGTDFSEETRHQVFVTGGLFRSVDYGLQFGLVVDYLNEDWYYQADLVQLRGEISWVNQNQLTYGFQFMVGVDDDSSTTAVFDAAGASISTTVNFEPTDQYRLFFRRPLAADGMLSGFAGWTDNDDGLFGGLVDVALSQQLMLNTGVTYLIPNEGDASGGNQQEGWNVSFGMTLRPAGFRNYRYSRPLMPVADNGTFMMDRL